MKQKKKEGLNKKTLRNILFDIFSNNPHKPMNYKQASKRITLSKPSDKQLVVIVLDEMTEQGILKEIDRGKYLFNIQKGQYTGTLEVKPNGAATLITDETSEDILITQRNMNHAMNGDVVRIYAYSHRNKKMLEGEVVEIIKRSQNTFTGKAELAHGFAFIIPDGKTLQNDIFIPPDRLKGVKNGQKVTVRIIDWPARSKNPIGEIVDVLGWAGEHKVEMHAIMAEFDLPSEFEIEVEKEAHDIPTEISSSEIRKRRDFRTTTTFTIDPEDAKDFDDAISIKKLGENYEIGVHIADVTHYINPGSILEEEAKKRATSVYLVDRVIPMLPEKLSNELCSLRPNEDKLCFSAVFEITPSGEIKDEWIGKTIIHSVRRFSYEEAQTRLETGKGDYSDELNTLNRIAKKLREARFKKGAIGFEKIEIKFRLDENGKPLGVIFRESKDAHQMIEEFMLLANKQVAERIGKATKNWTPKTFVYRIHDRPDEHKLQDFAGFIKQFGYKINLEGGNKSIAKSLNGLISSLKGKPEKDMIENLAIRSMAKAEYSTRNIGHYGLAFNYYSHFTSPIRRYPDMMAHRLLWHYLNKGKNVKTEEYEPLCKHSSGMEQRAAEAERASVKYKQAEFLSDKTGIPFDGIISGVTEFGIFVQITENKCEGLIPLRNLGDDFYIYDSQRMMVRGRHSGNVYRFGDKVRVIIDKVNLSRRQVDMLLYEGSL